MRDAATILCAIPAKAWEKKGGRATGPTGQLQQLLLDLGAVERRLGKRVAYEEERSRYAQLCHRIEEISFSNAAGSASLRQFQSTISQGAFPAIRIGGSYIDFLYQLQSQGDLLGADHPARIGCSILSPEQVTRHFPAYEKASKELGFSAFQAHRHRTWFIRNRVLPVGAGLIEIPDAQSLSPPAAARLDGRSLWERIVAWFLKTPQPGSSIEAVRKAARGRSTIPPLSNDWQSYGDSNRGDFMHERLRTQIRDADNVGVPVDLGVQRHSLAIEVLGEFMHQNPGRESPAAIPVSYGDGRLAAGFPIRCLTPLIEGWSPTKVFHVGLVSMRHLAIDRYIDINWYRNAEVQLQRGMIEADAECTRVSLEQLEILLDRHKGHRLQIHLYHTGFVPAVIGFYRAVAITLSSGRYEPGCLQVLPRMDPRPNGFSTGKGWPD